MTAILQFYAVRALVGFLEILPFSFLSWLAKRGGNLFYLFVPRRRKIAAKNLERVYGQTLSASQKKEIIWKSFENTALSVLELFLIRKIKKHAEQHVVLSGLDNLKTALSQGNGVVLITSHLGSWEYLAFLPYLSKIPCSVIVKSLRNEYLDREIDRLRRETTVVPIPKKNALREALGRLRKNQVVAILIDQWDGNHGLWVDFMGSPTSTTALPARLAAKTGAALVPAYCLRKGTGQYEIQLLPAVPFPSDKENREVTITQQLNEGLGNYIRQYPEQWLWGHRRWKSSEE